MKKFVKVPTAERLPEKFGHFTTFSIDNQQGYNYFDGYDNEFKPDNDREIEYWLEEVEDREDEMREMLEEILDQLKELVSHYNDIIKGDYSPMALRSEIDSANALIKSATELS